MNNFQGIQAPSPKNIWSIGSWFVILCQEITSLPALASHNICFTTVCCQLLSFFFSLRPDELSLPSQFGCLLPIICQKWKDLATACYPFKRCLHRHPVICVGAGKYPFGTLGRAYNSHLDPWPTILPTHQPAAILKVTKGSPASLSPGQQTASFHGMHKGKGSHRKDSSRSRKDWPLWESYRRLHQQAQGHGSDKGGECVPSSTHPWPTSRGKDFSPPWSMVMETLIELQNDLEALKEDRHVASGGTASTRVDVNKPYTEVIWMTPAWDCLGFDQCSSLILIVILRMNCPLVVYSCSVKSYGPMDDVSDEVDKHVATMVSHIFDCGMSTKKFWRMTMSKDQETIRL